MRTATVTFLLKEEGVYLARKKRRDGAGWWNGYGGDVGRGETISRAAVREIREEACVLVSEADLVRHAIVRTHLGLQPYFTVHVFTVRRWVGDLQETEEMGKPQWFGFWEVPYQEMFPDDQTWLPKVFTGEFFEADVVFSVDGKKLLKEPVIRRASFV